MRGRFFLACLLVTLGAGIPLFASAGVASQPCLAAISRAEAQIHVPDEFLAAIARVESGRADPETGIVTPWPWTVNAEGQGSFYATKGEAVEAVRVLQKAGVRSIDVGCLQVNLMHHPEAFGSLEQAFDPDSNARFAASFLVSLFGQTGSWPHAAAAYHSQTPTIGADYQKKVLAAWAMPPLPSRAAPGMAPRRAQDPDKDRPEVQDQAHPPALPAPPASWGGHAITSFSPPPAAARGSQPMGRDLAAYRTVPVQMAWRPPTPLARRGF